MRPFRNQLADHSLTAQHGLPGHGLRLCSDQGISGLLRFEIQARPAASAARAWMALASQGAPLARISNTTKPRCSRHAPVAWRCGGMGSGLGTARNHFSRVMRCTVEHSIFSGLFITFSPRGIFPPVLPRAKRHCTCIVSWLQRKSAVFAVLKLAKPRCYLVGLTGFEPVLPP